MPSDSDAALAPRRRFFLPILFALGFGCATFGGGPDDLQEAEPPEALEEVEETLAGPVGQVRDRLHQAFFELQNQNLQAASDSLGLASHTLILLLDPPVPPSTAEDSTYSELTQEERDGLPGLLRATIELYDDALPRSAGIPPDHPAARLIDALPPAVESSLIDHPRYRDLVLRKLAGTAGVPVDLTERVREKIRFFQTDGARVIRTWFQRSGTYDPLIRDALRKANLPEDLIYLSMIESGFNPKAYSRARAAGLWQFVRHTGRLYGLKNTTWVDERRDPVKATHAAIRHLEHLHRLFDDWRLVISAYNCGQGRLDRAIRQDGSRDFWKLDSLPRETRNHLPKFMAALLIGRDPEFFGIHDLVYDDPLAFDVVRVDEAVDLRVGAECAGTTYEALRRLNPELRLGYSPAPAAGGHYALRVPPGASERFVSRYARIPASRRVQLVEYKVRPGQTVSHIAHELGVSSRAILEANGIRDPRRLRAGKRLKIPVHPFKSAALASSATGIGDRVSYRVKKGDTLWAIAKRMGVRPRQIQAWNQLNASEHIHPGDRLTIFPSARAGEPTTTHYRVRRGDTLWEIARTFGTNVRELKRLNGIQDAARLRAGVRLRVRPVDAHVE